MDNGKVLHASHEGVEVLRYVGDIRYTLAPSLARFLEDLFSRTKPVGFVVDLREAGVIDSTNLGLLVRIAKCMEDRGGPQPTVISDQEDVDELLSALGLDEVFDVVRGDDDERRAEHEVPVAQVSGADVARTVLAAHRQLMALNENNRDQFRDVVALFEERAAGPPDSD
jgi:anti-anti-sigma factor